MTRSELLGVLRRRVSRDALARTVRLASDSLDARTLFVGGFVRDAALQRRVKDLDLVCTRRLDRLLEALEGIWGHRPFRFRKRGVTTWRFDVGGRQVDLVDARGRGLDRDLLRRELTINAMAFDPRTVTLHDPARGLADLRACRLRLPRPGVFLEDPVRPLRACRFLAELPSFELTPPARAEAIRVGPRLGRVAVERIRDEMNKLLTATDPARGLKSMQSLELLGFTLPECAPMLECRADETRPDVWSHVLDALTFSARPFRLPAASVVGQPAARRILRWALLLHDVAKPDTLVIQPGGRPTFHGHESMGAKRAEQILMRLRLPRSDRRRIGRLILQHLRPGHLADAGAPNSGLRRLVRDAGDDLPLLVLHAACDARSSGGPPDQARWRRLRRVLLQLLELQRRRRERPLPQLLDGRTLMRRLDLEAGPLIGRLLAAVHEEQEAGRLDSVDQALVFAERWLRQTPEAATEGG